MNLFVQTKGAAAEALAQQVQQIQNNAGNYKQYSFYFNKGTLITEHW